MTNNDILRRLRYSFDLNDSKMVAVFRDAEQQVTRVQISSWLKKDDDPAIVELSDPMMASFLNGLINQKRGKKDGPQPEPETRLNNNLIFRKLKIALNLIDDQVVEIMALAKVTISKHELSAFFRKPGHRNYRKCNDQVLRNFLKGLQLQLRPNTQASSPDKEQANKVTAKAEATPAKAVKKNGKTQFKWK